MDQNVVMIMVSLGLAVFDVVTGYVSAIKCNTLNSSVMREGLWSKLGEVFAICLCPAIEFVISLYGESFVHTSLSIPITTGVCAYVTLYEITSIIENIGKLNTDLGSWLVNTIGFEPGKVGLREVSDDDKQL